MISLLVPYKSDNGGRELVWDWLSEYWKYELPEAEVIIGTNEDTPFSKTKAVNEAARHAHGDIFVILDADTFLPGYVITRCADKIREFQARGYPLWFIPYRNIYRLTKEASARVLASDPRYPLRFPDPAPDIENKEKSTFGHRFGAMIQILPRVAFRGMDERFAGWGGEDVAHLKSVDTLFGKHKTTNNSVFHIWHPVISEEIVQDTWVVRQWEGQPASRMNDRLASRYSKASGSRSEMRALIK